MTTRPACTRHLLAEYPFEMEARHLLANTYWGQYRAEDAIRELQTLAVEEPQNEVIWSTLGSYLLDIGDFERAQPALERYAKLAPDDANSYALLGDSHRFQGQYQAAREQYMLALDIDPNMRSVAASLATIAYLEGDYQAAEQGFTAIVADQSLIISERLDSMFSLQALLAARGDFMAADSVLTQFSEALKEEKIREAMATSIRALLQLEFGNQASARELAESAISLSPGVPTRYLFITRPGRTVFAGVRKSLRHCCGIDFICFTHRRPGPHRGTGSGLPVRYGLACTGQSGTGRNGVA